MPKAKPNKTKKSKEKKKESKISQKYKKRSLKRRMRKNAAKVIQQRKNELEAASNNYILGVMFQPNGSNFHLSAEEADNDLQDVFDDMSSDFIGMFSTA